MSRTPSILLPRTAPGAARAAVRASGSIALRSPEEIDAMRGAGRVVRNALAAAEAACVVGATTGDVDRAAMEVIVEAGAEALFLGYPSPDGAMPFPACTCISINEEIVHGIPSTGRSLCDGDLVSIDCGVRLAGWCGDAAVTVPVGSVDADRLALLDAAERMLATAVAMAAPGIRWSDIAGAMQDIAIDGGYGAVVEYVGHGIGRRLHEQPQVPNALSAAFLSQGDFTLRPGMTLAIEPMLTLRGAGVDRDGSPRGVRTRRLDDGWTVVAADGSPAVHVEHTIAITRTGCEVLTVSLPTSTGSRMPVGVRPVGPSSGATSAPFRGPFGEKEGELRG